MPYFPNPNFYYYYEYPAYYPQSWVSASANERRGDDDAATDEDDVETIVPEPSYQQPQNNGREWRYPAHESGYPESLFASRRVYTSATESTQGQGTHRDTGSGAELPVLSIEEHDERFERLSEERRIQYSTARTALLQSWDLEEDTFDMPDWNRASARLEPLGIPDVEVLYLLASCGRTLDKTRNDGAEKFVPIRRVWVNISLSLLGIPSTTKRNMMNGLILFKPPTGWTDLWTQ